MSGRELRLVNIGTACPEQWDVLDEDGTEVAYLRLRHGHFTVRMPNVCGRIICEGYPNGDGAFDDDERDYWLIKAMMKICEELS